MGFWTCFFSKNTDSVKKTEVRSEGSIIPIKEVQNAPLVKKEEPVLPEINYEQFDKQPGKSVLLLNNDPNWNKFVRFESDNDEELVAVFLRKKFEEFILNIAYSKGIIKFKSIKESNGYKLSVSITETITTYRFWGNKHEPILCVNAMLLSPAIQRNLTHSVFEYTYIVRTPFAGHYNYYYKESENDGGKLYKLYTAHRTKELWPDSWFNVYDELDKLNHIDVSLNGLMYDRNFFSKIPYFDFEAEGKNPCFRYEWKVDNLSNIAKGQHVCSIIKNPYKNKPKEYKIYSPTSGIIAIGITSEKTEYCFQAEMNLTDFYSVYKDRQSLINKHFFSHEVIDKDHFDDTVSLRWSAVAGRTLPPSKKNNYLGVDYTGFEMATNSDKYIIVSLQVKNNIPYIVFSINTQKIRISSGDIVELLFEDLFGKKRVLCFPITKNYIDEHLEDLYDISFFCELNESDINCMKENKCVSWRVKFYKQPLMPLTGFNESRWCPKEYAGDVFKAYVNHYLKLIEQLREEYTIDFSSSIVSNASMITNDVCFVYLMYDSSNGYYKIGISNQPEYREKTLQSEKPTIEKICAKAFPNRAIARAIESALHKTYESKRIRGEWFSLDIDDIKSIISTLN